MIKYNSHKLINIITVLFLTVSISFGIQGFAWAESKPDPGQTNDEVETFSNDQTSSNDGASPKSDKKILATVFLTTSFIAIPAKYDDNRVEGNLGYGLPVGLQFELLFLEITSGLWLGGIADIAFQPAIGNTNDLIDETGKYGTIRNAWSIIPSGGLTLQYYFKPQFRLGFSVLTGYDVTFVEVIRGSQTQVQPGGGFALMTGLSADYILKIR